ncbi:CHAT domain-containing protein [Paraoerskovia sediminicola]|uniref:CHAT domain-containing protein n=1 Tax=Paraoerskovia sediminicola TaxID=1138587 RepID=A0ABN6X976_9CELL|nr:CHAT domain-containing protein [Paraoerskovia sediminicola]
MRTALRELDEATSVLGGESTLDLAVLLLNRGALRLEQGELALAAADLEAALHHSRQVGDRSIEAKAGHNLGYLEFLRGDLAAALRAMEDAARIAPGERPEAVAALDRSRVLYEAGLVTDAMVQLDLAAEALQGTRTRIERAQVDLDRARCALDLEQPQRARRLAQRARRAFTTQGNAAWALRAELVELRAVMAGAAGSPAQAPTLGRVARAAEALAARADELGVAESAVSLPARLLRADALVRAGRVGEAQEALSGVRTDPRRAPLSLRIEHEAVRASVWFAAGERRRGLQAVRRGHAALAAQRARLGSVDAVTAAAAHGVHLQHVDVRAALATGRGAAVFDAVERGRATFARGGAVSGPEDERRAQLVTRARELLERARALGPGDVVSAERDALFREARACQDQARAAGWGAKSDQVEVVALTARALTDALRDEPGAAVLDLLQMGGRLVGIMVDGDGVRMRDLGPLEGVLDAVRRASADLGALADARLPEAIRGVARASLDRSLDRIDRGVLAAMGATHVERLHVVARDVLLQLPWGALPSRAGLPTSVNSWTTLARSGPPGESLAVDDARSVLAVAGPQLEHANAEVRAVAARWPAATRLQDAAATCAATRAAMPGASVIHLAAHGTHVPDNPLFSSVRLADGELFAHELEGAAVEGAVVVLSACEVGRSTRRVGGEVLGLKSAFLRLGASAVIAAVAPLRDDVAAAVMPELHGRLAAGDVPDVALAAALPASVEPVPLVCFGPLRHRAS